MGQPCMSASLRLKAFISRWLLRRSPRSPPSPPSTHAWRNLLRLRQTPWTTAHPSLRPRLTSRSSTPAPPSAAIGRLLPRPSSAAEQALDRPVDLFADDVADEGDEVRRSRHRRPPWLGREKLFHNP